ncbi:tail assembly chaperone [Escherichia coli]|nr:tail assembly chaperone [Escherichia coli]
MADNHPNTHDENRKSLFVYRRYFQIPVRISYSCPEKYGCKMQLFSSPRQSLIDAAMASISLIQLKLQAGRKLTQAETARLNAVLDYIDAVAAIDTSIAPDVIWPELPEA